MESQETSLAFHADADADVTPKCCPRNAPSHVTSAAARIRHTTLLLADTFAIIEESIASRCPARVSLLDGKKPWAPMCLLVLRPAIMAAMARVPTAKRTRNSATVPILIISYGRYVRYLPVPTGTCTGSVGLLSRYDQIATGTCRYARYLPVHVACSRGVPTISLVPVATLSVPRVPTNRPVLTAHYSYVQTNMYLVQRRFQ